MTAHWPSGPPIPACRWRSTERGTRSPADRLHARPSAGPLRRQPVLAVTGRRGFALFLVGRDESTVHLLERIALQRLEVAVQRRPVPSAQGTRQRRARSGKPALNRLQIWQRLFSRHAELALELVEKLPPQERREIARQDAERVVA